MTVLSFLGGYQEVGRSAILVNTGTERILMDYGVKVDDEPMGYPLPVKVKLNAILIPHPHLDHLGGVPLLFKQGQKCPIYGLPITKPFMKMLLLDSLKIADYDGRKERFSKRDIEVALKRFKPVKYRQPFKIGKTEAIPFDAGHVPGSIMYFLRTPRENVLYTGDFNLSDTRLVQGADLDVPDVDVLIMESTYSYREHPDRLGEEIKFVDMVKGTLDNDGTCVIASFAISRAQEVLLILDEYEVKYPIYMDGMAVKATKVISRYPGLQRDYNQVKRALLRCDVKFVSRASQRKRIVKKPSIVITTSGMLNGGPVVNYIKKLYKREDCSLIMTGFQVPGTEGANLLQTGRYLHEDLDLKVKMNVTKFDFSSHSSRSQLFGLVKRLNPRKVFCIHGDKTEDFARELREDHGFDAIAPSHDNRRFKL